MAPEKKKEGDETRELDFWRSRSARAVTAGHFLSSLTWDQHPSLQPLSLSLSLCSCVFYSRRINQSVP